MSFSPILLGLFDRNKKPPVKRDVEKEWRDKVNKKLNDKKIKK